LLNSLSHTPDSTAIRLDAKAKIRDIQCLHRPQQQIWHNDHQCHEEPDLGRRHLPSVDEIADYITLVTFASGKNALTQAIVSLT
jgi:hypothetical protein